MVARPAANLGPFKSAIGWVRLVELVTETLPDGSRKERIRVEKMSYEDEEIDRNPDVIIDATSSPCGIEFYSVGKPGAEWVITVGGNFHSRHTTSTSIRDYDSAWAKAKKAVVDMSVLDWMALL